MSMYQKTKKLKIWAVVLLCMLFAISGLYTQNSQTNSFSTYKHRTSTASIQWNERQLLDTSDACTGEQIGTYDAQTILNISVRLERSVRVSLTLFLCFYVLPIFLWRYIGWYYRNRGTLPLHQSRRYIICYIHEKDGEKDHLS